MVSLLRVAMVMLVRNPNEDTRVQYFFFSGMRQSWGLEPSNAEASGCLARLLAPPSALLESQGATGGWRGQREEEEQGQIKTHRALWADITEMSDMVFTPHSRLVGRTLTVSNLR